ncbi:MAG: LytTR family DNA-binding domain-containing protein [Bacteroidota bacterium]
MKREHLAITTTTGLIFIKRSAVLYCCSDGAYTNIYVQGGRKLTVSKNLKEVEAALATDLFIRIHNSHLINLDHAVGYINNNYNCVKMSNGEELAVSRNRKKELMECFVKI